MSGLFARASFAISGAANALTTIIPASVPKIGAYASGSAARPPSRSVQYPITNGLDAENDPASTRNNPTTRPRTSGDTRSSIAASLIAYDPSWHV